MTRPLAQSVREQLGRADPVVDGWAEEDKERMRTQAEAISLAYPMPQIRIAQFLMEVAMGLQPLADYGDGNNLDEFPPEAQLATLKANIRNYKDGLVALASVVSRRARGRTEL